MIGIPVVLIPIRAQYNEGLSLEIQNKRLSIFAKDVVTLISGLHDYISLLLNQGNKAFQFSSNVPWKIETRIREWTIHDEIIASSVLLILNYSKLASLKVSLILQNDKTVEEDKSWKVSTNWLKQSISLVNFLTASTIYNNSIEILSLNFLNLLNHLSESAVQLNLLAKINFAKLSAIIQNDWNFDVDAKNNLIYLKICIFIADELSICEQIVTSLSDEKQIIEYLRYHKLYIKIYIAYYLSLEHYAKGKIGLSIGILNYIKNRLLKDEENSDDVSNKFRKKMLSKFSKSSQSEKDLIKQIASEKDFKINKKFAKVLTQPCHMDLINLVRLVNLIHLKFIKENDNIRFDEVSDQEEVVIELAKLPMGRKIPLTIDEMPSFLKSDNFKKQYVGSGAYF